MEEDGIRGLTDDALRQRLKDLASVERRATTALLIHLAEYDRRGLYVADGFAHLWDYCERVLQLGPNEIKLRIQAARAIRDRPALRDMLERGETTATSIGRLAPHLKEPGGERLIEQARNKTQLEVRALVAGVEAANAVTERRRAQIQEEEARPSLFPDQRRRDALPPSPADCSTYVRERERDAIVPVSVSDYRVSFIAEETFVRSLQQVQALLARRYPEARFEDVLGAVCELFLAKADPIRRAEARRARATARSAGQVIFRARKAISAKVRDEVLERYRRRCAFEGSEGRCPENRRLELDHIVPVARGGTDAAENLRPLCVRHHGFVTVLAFGAAYIESAIRRRKQCNAAGARVGSG